MKPGVVIVGAGLAGSILAAKLRTRYAVTVIELRDSPAPLPTPISETGVPSRLEVHAGAGPGGTTNFWHNGLIEVEDEDYAAWPATKAELEPYVARSLDLLSGVAHDALAREDALVRARLVKRGVPNALLGKSLFSPRVHRNMWTHLCLPGRDVACVTGVARRFDIANGTTTAVTVETANGTRRVEGDIFIASAGGLSSPALLSATAEHAGLHLPAIGRHYHDHPMTSVGQMTLSLKLHDALHHSAPSIRGALRIPFVTRVGDAKFAFYLRTQELDRHHAARSALRALRDHPRVWRNYWKVLSSGRGVLEVLVFRFGIDLPTSTFSIRMVAEQPPDDTLTLSGRADGSIVRNWTLAPDFPRQVEQALRTLLDTLGSRVVHFAADANWQNRLQTAAHHSGGCRMANSLDQGVCDRNLRVFGTDNLYVCDGSALPSSGYANTGLMIGAIALRLADHLIART
jgi:choline dehydrogenase-like flavoprotein